MARDAPEYVLRAAGRGPVHREQQVAGYLDGAPSGTPLFLWVHFFEPHEPYVAHPEHPFAGGPSADVDRYDSEVATADEGIARIVRRFAVTSSPTTPSPRVAPCTKRPSS